jgi:hypothetical protein
LTFPTHPDAPPLETLCQISDRLGCLKVEKTGIVKFFSQAAKTYSYETVDGEITLKAKGFSLLEKLLKDNLREKILETNLTEMFSSLATDTSSSVRVFQKQIRVNPIKGVPALIPKPNSYKMLNFIGPRRQIHIDGWLKFEFERCAIQPNLQIDPLRVVGHESAIEELTYNCKNVTTLQRDESVAESSENFQVRLTPKLQGILPALPFGFDLTRLVEVVKFYELLSN